MTGLEVVDSVTSTQDEVHAWGEAGRTEGALLALAQTAARGSRGSTWEAPRGGLWLSLLLRPHDAAATDVLPLRVGLAVATVLEGLPGMPEVRLKWPNDLMVADRKLGGILCEARWRGGRLAWVVVGVGLNLSNPLPRGTRVAPARLADHLRPPAVEALARLLVAAIAPLASARGTLAPAELVALERRDWLRGRALVTPAPGTVVGITANGALCVRGPDGHTTLCRTGPVEPVGAATRS